MWALWPYSAPKNTFGKAELNAFSTLLKTMEKKHMQPLRKYLKTKTLFG